MSIPADAETGLLLGFGPAGHRQLLAVSSVVAYKSPADVIATVVMATAACSRRLTLVGQ